MELTQAAATATASRLRGIGVSPGVARGPIVAMGDPLPAPDERASTRSSSDELATARRAVASVAADLRARAAGASGPARDVLEAQALMAEDPALGADVERRIGAGLTAARAIWEACGAFHEMFTAGGALLAARAADLDDVRDRLVAACLGVAVPKVPDPGHPFVLTARALSPADTATLRADQVLAIVTVEGSPTSHTAILARALGIPAVVGCAGVTSLADGAYVVVDGETGEVRTATRSVRPARVFTPTSDDVLGAGRTRDGTPIALLANIGGPAEVAAAVAAGAEGVGLLRTEFLYLGANEPPSAVDQEAALREVLARFPSRLVVVRLLDAGGDKKLPFLSGHGEPNPALGVRGLRALRAHDHILGEQLDAIVAATAASSARVAVMAPMVTDAGDAAWFAERVRGHRGWPDDISLGVMIETPAAALTAANVLAHSDFASIGTNDLTQYVMAADRSLGALSALQNPWHPAVLSVLASAAGAAREASKPLGVCGEAAADPLLALALVGLGVTSLSMTPAALGGVRAALARHSLAECEAIASAALAGADVVDARSKAQAASIFSPSEGIL